MGEVRIDIAEPGEARTTVGTYAVDVKALGVVVGELVFDLTAEVV